MPPLAFVSEARLGWLKADGMPGEWNREKPAKVGYQRLIDPDGLFQDLLSP
jgi:hypothetical protein